MTGERSEGRYNEGDIGERENTQNIGRERERGERERAIERERERER